MFTNLKLNGSLTPNLGPTLFPNLMLSNKTKIGPVKDHFIWLKVEIVELPALGRGEAVKVTLQSLLTTVNSWSGQCTVVLWTRGVGSSSTVDSVGSAEWLASKQHHILQEHCLLEIHWTFEFESRFVFG